MGALISQNIQYGGATLSQQSTPIGAIIPYMGTTAPSGYLACDGGVYNISLYPLLAGFFETQFGSINYFGGDGTTTFAVPNLQGEFLRGAGTNSHANQGNGGDPGEHQDGTMHSATTVGSDNAGYLIWTDIQSDNWDAYISNNRRRNYISGISNSGGYLFTSRPTNTSVLYIIKAKSDRLDKITFAEVDDASEADDVVWSGEKISSEISRITEYSTSEKVVGKWIDGKPLYQKTVIVNSSYSVEKDQRTSIAIPFSSTNTLNIVSVVGHIRDSRYGSHYTLPGFKVSAVGVIAYCMGVITTNTAVNINLGGITENFATDYIRVTATYTKTTD